MCDAGQTVCLGGARQPCYKMAYFHDVSSRVAFKEAGRACRMDGGSLLSIESSAEQADVENLLQVRVTPDLLHLRPPPSLTCPCSVSRSCAQEQRAEPEQAEEASLTETSGSDSLGWMKMGSLPANSATASLPARSCTAGPTAVRPPSGECDVTAPSNKRPNRGGRTGCGLGNVNPSERGGAGVGQRKTMRPRNRLFHSTDNSHTKRA